MSELQPVQLKDLRVLIVEDDESVGLILKEALEDFGIPDVVHEMEGQRAWQLCADRNFDFFILDWAVPQVNGLALFNRIRQHRIYAETPILVVSGFVNKKDFRLVEEAPFSAILEKPVVFPTLKNKMELLLKEQAWFRSVEKKVKEVFEKLSGNPSFACEKITQVLEKSPNPVPLGIFAARQFRALGQFAYGETILQQVFNRVPNSLIVMTEMGQLKLHQNDHQAAAQLFESAQRLSPENVSRLCLIANTRLQALQFEEAQKAFATALRIDRTNPEARKGQKLTEQLEEFQRANPGLEGSKNLVSLLNGVGITMVRSGNISEGLKHYKNAWRYIFGEEAKSRLAFNIGLAYIREKSPRQAYRWFCKSAELSDNSFEKAIAYKDKLLKKFPQYKIIAEQDLAEEVSEELTLFEDFVFEADSEVIQIQPLSIDYQQVSSKKNPGDETDESAPKNRQQLINEIPESRDLLKALQDKGFYVEPHVRGLLALRAEFGSKLLRLAVQVALKKANPTSHRVRAIVEDLASRLPKDSQAEPIDKVAS